MSIWIIEDGDPATYRQVLTSTSFTSGRHFVKDLAAYEMEPYVELKPTEKPKLKPYRPYYRRGERW